MSDTLTVLVTHPDWPNSAPTEVLARHVDGQWMLRIPTHKVDPDSWVPLKFHSEYVQQPVLAAIAAREGRG